MFNFQWLSSPNLSNSLANVKMLRCCWIDQKYIEKNHIRFGYTPRRRPHSRIPPSLPCCFCITMMTSHWKTFFWPGDLDLWPMTLTFELDLDIHLTDMPKFKSVRLSARPWEWDTHTHRMTMPKTITYVADAGCKNTMVVFTSRMAEPHDLRSLDLIQAFNSERFPTLAKLTWERLRNTTWDVLKANAVSCCIKISLDRPRRRYPFWAVLKIQYSTV